MKTNKNTTRWLGLALAGSITIFAVSAQAGKPVKPPKPPPPPPSPSGPAYQVIALDAANLYPNAISDSGILAGLEFYEPDPNDSTHWMAGFTLPPRIVEGEIQYHAQDAQRLEIGVVDDNWSEAEAFDVNRAGIAVGYAFAGYAPPLRNRATLWLADGTPINLGVGGDNYFDQAAVINDGGLVAVRNPANDSSGVIVPLDADEDGEPDVWFADFDADGVNDLLYPIEVGSGLTPVAINEAGQVAFKEGYLLTPDFEDGDGDGNPWFADRDGDDVNDLLIALTAPAADLEVNDLNNLGQVVGSSGDHVVRWEFVGGEQVVTDLGSLSPSLAMFPQSMNDSGQIVGTSTKTVRKGGSGPSWLIDHDTIYELSFGPCSAINNNGWICGHGFVAIPVAQP